MTDWAVPQQAKLKYTQLFNLHDRSRSGSLSGVQCRDILLQSGLPRNILAEIWNLSDIDGDGQLTREEFILAMHLTNQVRTGQTLPSELPADLVPPSYRRTRSISTTSAHSASSTISGGGAGSTVGVGGGTTSIQDDQLSQKSSDTAPSVASSVLNSHSFEDKRRENFEKGRAELERRRCKMIEQQASILNEQLIACKKQVAEAKAKIDKMRSERDTKAGLITSLEAQLQTIRDRKAYLDHEEQTLIAIAKDLNIVNSANATEIDLEATKVKQENIKLMKERLVGLQQERDSKVAELGQATSKLDEMKQEHSSVSEEASKLYEKYKEKVSNAKVLRQKFIEENKTKPNIDLDSVWDSTPSFSPKTITQQQQSNNSFKLAEQPQDLSTPFESTTTTAAAAEDPWTATTKVPTNNNQITKSPDEAFGFGDEPAPPTSTTTNNNNNINARDYSALADLSSKTGALSISQKNDDGFGDDDQGFKALPSTTSAAATNAKRKYRALYAFEARNPDELTINPGDIITGSEVVCEPGWLSGEANGQSGLFPEAYVEPLPASLVDNLSTITANSLNNSAKGNSIQTPTATVASSSPVEQQQTKQLRYKVIYEFEARNPDELTIRSGDIINGVDGAHEPGWLMGELNGQKGLFPEAYVEKMVAESQTAEPIQTEQTTTTTGKSRAKKAEVATVIANYRALGQEQLNLEKGQLVLIRRKMDSGWWEGELQIKDNEPGENRTRSQLDHLIEELINSEWDFVNDLRLCQSAYIIPLSSSFDVSHIFKNWNQLIQVHEIYLNKLTENCSRAINDSQASTPTTMNYALVFDIFQQLFNSIVELYIEFCSHQSESVRQLESKIVSDIRFRQLVNESQRKLHKILEQQEQKQRLKRQQQQLNATSDIDNTHDSVEMTAQYSRALRNSNLPLTSFLIKPMQRITKYSLIFERILAIVCKHGHTKQFQSQVEKLKNSSQSLCRQVNEACRAREDNQENRRRLRWCQNHIKQSADHHQPVGSASSASDFQRINSIRLIDRRLSESFSSYSSQDSISNSSSICSSNLAEELIEFDSETNCLAQRQIIKAGSLIKIKSSCRDLVAFLFNDLLLLTQVKGGITLRVEDIFKSERAQQAYYKIYKNPIMLEDVLVSSSFASGERATMSSMNITCSSTGSGSISEEQEALVFNLIDQRTGNSFNLMALNAQEKTVWVDELTERSQAAKEASNQGHATSAGLHRFMRRLSVDECLGRLFVTVLELDRSTNALNSFHQSSPSPQNCSTPDRRRPVQSSALQNVCIRMQLRRYRKRINSGGRVCGEIIPLSDTFKTRTVLLGNIGGTLHANGSDSSQKYSTVDNQTSNHDGNNIKFEPDESNQFLLANKLIDCDEQDYLDIELVEDFRYKPTKLIARKRLNIDQLLGRDSCSTLTRIDDYSTTTIDSLSSRASSRQSMRAVNKPLQALQPNRPIEMDFKLKPVQYSDGGGSMSVSSRHSTPPSSMNQRTAMRDQNTGSGLAKISVKLKLHLQLFCDKLS